MVDGSGTASHPRGGNAAVDAQVGGDVLNMGCEMKPENLPRSRPTRGVLTAVRDFRRGCEA